MVEYKCTHKKICVRKLPIKIMCHLSNSQNKLENRDRNIKESPGNETELEGGGGVDIPSIHTLKSWIRRLG
jgi:hypothetical protein